MNSMPADIPQPRILRALHSIQDKHGYLVPGELMAFSKASGIPLYRLQAVASFFPHFHLAPPPAVTVSICRDMACHLAGSPAVRAELQSISDKDLQVRGVSCLGRCDRAPAVCITVQSAPGKQPAAPARAGAEQHSEHEYYFHGRSAGELKHILREFTEKKGMRNKPDVDAPQSNAKSPAPYPSPDWKIDPYAGSESDFAAVKAVAAARRASIRQASEVLKTQCNWSDEEAELFRLANAGLAEISITKEMQECLRSWKTGDNWSDAFLTELDDSHADLRGLGGAGIPATQKWRDVRDAVRTAIRRNADPRAFVVVNGDESEPGTFKDRELLLHFPHLIVEAVIVAALITDATEGFIYIRNEYPEQIAACRRAIRRAEELGFCGSKALGLGRPLPVSVFVSPGGYICGEQSALIEAMSDRRGEPRNMPPKLETNGLDDRPTLVSNVETFAWVPYILIKGGESYAAMGVNGTRGRRFFSVSGDVNRPGVYEVPMGMTLRELILGESYCRGIIGGRKLKAFAPSGPSGGFLPAKLTAAAGLPRKYLENKTWQAFAARRGLDPAATELDILELELELNIFRALSPTAMLGAGLVVYAEGRDMAAETLNSVEFFRNESCGKCVPCRIGSQKLVSLGRNLLRGKIDSATWTQSFLPAVNELTDVMSLTSICGLGRSVPFPLRTLIDYFPDDLARHLAAAPSVRQTLSDAPIEAAYGKVSR